MDGRDSLKAAAPAVKLTYDDFVLFPDDGKRHELIGGEHYVTPSPNTRHQGIVGTIHGLIWSYLQTHPIGVVFVAPFDVVFSEFDVVEPDVLYMSNQRRADVLTEQNVRGAPELVIEVASKGTRRRDETIKRRLYERAGVSEYWMIDPEQKTVRLYRRDGERFASAAALSVMDVIQSPLLPGLDMPIARVFSEL